MLSQWLDELTNQKKISTTSELLDSLRIKEASNQIEDGMIRAFIEYKRDNRPSHLTKASFESIQTYHSFTKHDLHEVSCQVLSSNNYHRVQYMFHFVNMQIQGNQNKQVTKPKVFLLFKTSGEKYHLFLAQRTKGK